MVLCFLELLCLAYCGLRGMLEGSTARAFSISAMASGLVASICLVFGGRNKQDLLRKEAIAVVGLWWIICSLFGAMPYLLCEPGLNPVDSFFESMSGFTTTGASVMADL